MMWVAEPPTASSGAFPPPFQAVRSVAPLEALLESLVSSHRAGRVVPEKKIARRYFVSGMVQGVGFRFFVARSARRLGLAGYAKNLRDGRVEVYAVGPSVSLAALRSDLRRGPSGAMVEDVSEEEAPVEPQFANEFSIEHEDW
jgi:acylphosphatase